MGNFAGLRVLALESRRAEEIARLITSSGGAPVVAPSMREAPLESNKEALAFASDLRNGRFPVVIFLTGVGARALARVVQSVYPLEEFIDALRKSAVVARGPKPAAVLREWGVPIAVAVPEPNTWRELLRSLDEHSESAPVRGCRVAVQEYGAPNPELLAGLAERGAIVTRVPVYQWTLPENTGPLRDAVAALAREEIDVVLFTTSIQIEHLLQVAGEMGLVEPVRRALRKAVLASIGPTTSEALREHGLAPDLEPSHPKMGFLVKEAAAQSSALLAAKRSRQPAP
ncbi:MAG TPA: uroporphyrinogen-III synthase [Bryobacterales bacterium]|jgi:uroporphyrinogen-III synthase|nr:uroporphyrinogen-III synthase [Bryobacterales bacterium]